PPAGAAAATGSPRDGAGPLGQGDRTVVIDGDRQGHFLAGTAVEGRHLTMMVDTGATIVALTHEDAAAVGIRPAPTDYRARMSTANGEVAAARVRIREIRIGEIYVRDVDAVVMPRGRLRTSLLGMSFLRQLRGFDIAQNRLTLRG
uniref:retropepsin-like aspartic protease family protein n=1 Tax=uncultured Enterovirga sp. TaxID=2026352 RepID=UPI0035CA4A5C